MAFLLAICLCGQTYEQTITYALDPITGEFVMRTEGPGPLRTYVVQTARLQRQSMMTGKLSWRGRGTTTVYRRRLFRGFGRRGPILRPGSYIGPW